jgi:DNA-binding transcriptional MerR regulator
MAKKVYMLSEIARRFGLPLRTLRYVADNGIVPDLPKSAKRGSTRLFTGAQMQHIACAVHMLRAGLTSQKIKQLFKSRRVRTTPVEGAEQYLAATIKLHVSPELNAYLGITYLREPPHADR